jgi:hypothetical protein
MKLLTMHFSLFVSYVIALTSTSLSSNSLNIRDNVMLNYSSNLQAFIYMMVGHKIKYFGVNIRYPVVTRLRAGRPRFDSWQGQGFLLFATGSRP